MRRHIAPFTLSNDTTISISLTQKEYTTTFTVEDKGTSDALTGVSVTFGDETQDTKSSGEAAFTTFSGSKDYLLEVENYNSVSGTMDVSDNSTVSVKMEAIINALTKRSTKQLLLYPNEKENMVTIVSEEKAALVC